MTNDKLADEIERQLRSDGLRIQVDGLSDASPHAAVHRRVQFAAPSWKQIIAALRSERPQSGEMVMPCSITVGAARFGVGVKVETVQAAINRAFVRLQNAEHIEGKLRELLVGTLPFFELLEKIRLAAAEAERGKT